jgi:hypothetical protein
LKRIVLLAAALALLALPIHGISVAGYLRGIAGDLSITTLLLLVSAAVAFAGGPRLHDRRETLTLAAVVLPGALVLYPMALGLTSFDPYALGYPDQVRGLLFGLAPVAFLGWFRGGLLVPLSVALALVAFRFELLDSRNLWDYLFDPWLVLLGRIYDLRPILQISVKSPGSPPAVSPYAPAT